MAPLIDPEDAPLRPLFGGALAVHCPCGWVDASSIREVPDHQEVFVGHTAESKNLSLIVEILELEPKFAGEGTVRCFFDDVATVNEADPARTVWSGEQAVSMAHVRETQGGGRAGMGVQFCGKFSDNRDAEEVAIAMGLVRLPAATSDVLISLNMPQSSGVDPEVGLKLVRRIVAELQIRSWSLFGG